VSPTVYQFTDSSIFGGAEAALASLAGGLRCAGWNVTVVYHPSPGIEPLIAEGEANGVSFWPVAPMPLGPVGMRRVPNFIRALKSRRPDIFHAHLTWPLSCKFALASAILANVSSVVATEHLFFDFRLKRSAALQQRLLARGVDRYLAVSNHTAQNLKEKLGLPARKIEVVVNAIDPERFKAPADDTLCAQLRGPDSRPVVLCVARLHEQKGQRFLLEAARLISDARFVFVGDGPERQTLELQSEALGISERVLFLGSRSDVPALLRCCDVFALASLYEGLPISTLEAMAACRPVVATAVGGTPEAVIDGVTGLLVPARDSVALAAAIKGILGNPRRAQAMGAAGHERVSRHFSKTQMVAHVLRVYEDVLAPDSMGGRLSYE
jgi:glycosyltransferase involved in cell wall biosynthesis